MGALANLRSLRSLALGLSIFVAGSLIFLGSAGLLFFIAFPVLLLGTFLLFFSALVTQHSSRAAQVELERL